MNPPWGLSWRSSTTFIVGVIAIALFTDLFLYGLIVPVLPFVLKDRLGLPDGDLQKTTSILLGIYAGSTVITSPLAGIISDKTPNRQLPFFLGLFALTASQALYFSRSLAGLAAARIFQGMSAAIVWTVGFSLVYDTVGSKDLGKTMGSIFSFISTGELAAPLLGGVIYDKVGYYGTLVVAFALLGLDFILRGLLIEKKTARKYERRTFADDRDFGEAEGPTEETSLLPSDDKTPQTLITRVFPLAEVMKNPRLLAAFWLAFVGASIVTAFDATIPTVAKDYFGFSSLQAGILFAPLTVPYLLVGPVAGWWVDRKGPKQPAVIGYTLTACSLAALYFVRPGGKPQIILYSILLALNGTFSAFSGSSSFVQASTIVEDFSQRHPKFFGPKGAHGALYGCYNVAYSSGMLAGPLIAGGLRDAIGYANMNLVLSAVSIVTAVIAYFYIG
ncbi:hypothetical protein PYCC9005_005347 [Savitreella phatthalungensis]